MELNLQNKLHHQIADLLWEAKDRERIKDIVKVYGVDAVIVLNMMLAAYYDEVDAIDLVEPILQKYRL
jgi:hypothetical protein